ncbi:hypothetical protein BDZ89DRAFT_1147060 [Hymenopellis radicata]|nr:hypothetical protein BDZ89DRAFT_1147060 [Hymenopellis radicata]
MLLRSIARALNIWYAPHNSYHPLGHPFCNSLPEVSTYYADSENVACPIDLVQLVVERATATDDTLNVDPRIQYDDSVHSWDWTWDASDATPTYVPSVGIRPINDNVSDSSCSIWDDDDDRERAMVEPAFQYFVRESPDASTRVLDPIKAPLTRFFPRTDYSQGDPTFVPLPAKHKRGGKAQHHAASRSRNARARLDSKGYQELHPKFDSLKVESLNLSSTNWSGRALPRLVGEAIVDSWQSFTLGPALKMFHHLPFKDLQQLPSKVFDVKGRLIIYRSNLIRLFAPSPAAGPSAGLNALALVECASTFMRDFVTTADRFVAATTKYIGDNVRGSHWFMISGHDRQNKERPALTTWHKQNIKPLQELFARGEIFDRTSEYQLPPEGLPMVCSFIFQASNLDTNNWRISWLLHTAFLPCMAYSGIFVSIMEVIDDWWIVDLTSIKPI